jgi:hypothetical protein
MPVKLPGPSVGTAAQPAPNGWLAAAGAGVSVVALALLEALEEALPSDESSDPQAPSGMARLATAARRMPRLRRVLVT